MARPIPRSGGDWQYEREQQVAASGQTARERQTTTSMRALQSGRVVPRIQASTGGEQYTGTSVRPVEPVFHAHRREPQTDTQRNVYSKRVGDFHWLFWVGVGAVFILVVYWVGGQVIMALSGRLVQTQNCSSANVCIVKARVGFGDSATPSYFTGQNVNGNVVIVECPAGDCTKAVSYVPFAFMGDNPDQQTFTLSFAVTTDSGKQDMILTFTDGKRIVLVNNGSEFVLPKGGK